MDKNDTKCCFYCYGGKLLPIYQKFAPLENSHLPKKLPLWKIPIYQKFAPLENSHLPKNCPFGKFPSTKNLPLPIYQKFAPLENSHLPKICPFGKFPSTKKIAPLENSHWKTPIITILFDLTLPTRPIG